MPKYYRIYKIGKKENIESLYRDGEMFFKPINYFKKQEKNSQRFDPLENALSIDQLTYLKILEPISGLTLIKDKRENPEDKTWSANVIEHGPEIAGNIFCCTGVNDENKEYLKVIPKELVVFGDALLVIHDVAKFIERIFNAARKLNITCGSNKVNYYNKYEFVGNLGPFSKPEEFKKQCEVRIWLDIKNNEDYIMKIGSLKDISYIYDFKSKSYIYE